MSKDLEKSHLLGTDENRPMSYGDAGEEHVYHVRGGKLLPRQASLRIPVPFQIPSQSYVSVDDKDEAEFKYVDPQHKRGLFAKLFKDRESTPEEIEVGRKERNRVIFSAILVIVAMFVDGLRPITLIWAKDGHKEYPFVFSNWIVAVKFMVILLSIIMYYLAPASERDSDMTIRERFSVSIYLIPPTMLYVFSDLLNFYMFEYISASTFSVVKQSRLVIVAFLFRFFLERYISQIQWIAVVQLLMASILFEAKKIDAPSSSGSDTSGEMFGISLLILKCFLDSLAVIWMDKYFKKLADSGFSYPQQQITYAVYGFIIGLTVTLAQEGTAIFARPFFEGWTTGAWVSALLSAFYGLLVSIVLRYLDSMIKMFQSLMAVVVTILLDKYFFGEQIDVVKSIAIGFVLISVFLYKLGTVKKKKN